VSSQFLLEEFHVGIYIPRRLADEATDRVRQVVDSRQFRSRLGRAVRAMVREFPALRPVRVRVSR
jgi:hypothetical protein